MARRLAGAGLAALLLVVAVPTPPAGAAIYDRFYANFAGEELMRAINADRRARGLSALATDSTLEAIARDRPLACPSRPSLIIRGRARDMAERGYLSHTIQGCNTSSGDPFGSFDLLTALGYSANAEGEIISDNNYPSSAKTYHTGCTLGGGSCHGSITLPWTVAVAERGFMSSSGHRAIVLSTTYDRFGCGAWSSSAGVHYFSCYFSRSGNGLLDKAGPVFSGVSGVGAKFKTGSTPTFTATVKDGLSLLSNGRVSLDGKRLRRWAWDHAGLSAGLSVTVPALKAGSHTLTWWVRDASTRSRSYSFRFSVG